VGDFEGGDGCPVSGGVGGLVCRLGGGDLDGVVREEFVLKDFSLFVRVVDELVVGCSERGEGISLSPFP